MYTIPNLKLYQNAMDFFREFYQINQPVLSYRTFAMALNWPVSLLGDMIQGRKKLTVNRAVEFAKHANLNSVQYEYLIMLSLKEVNNVGVQEYANNFFKTEGVTLTLDPSVQPETHHFMSVETYSNTDYLVLHAFLTWSKGHIDLDSLPRWLPAFPKFKDRDFVLSLLTKMNEDEVISGMVPQVTILKKNLLSPKATPESQIAYLELFKSISSRTPDMVTWRAGSVIFPKRRIEELHDKMNALTSWILMSAQNEEPTPASPLEEHTILQIILSEFEILDFKGATSSPDR